MGVMTLKEMQEIAKRLDELREANTHLAKTRNNLSLCNEAAAKDRGFWGLNWSVDLLLRKGDGYGKPSVSVTIKIPFGVVQQQLVDEVRRAERDVVRLGGSTAGYGGG